MSHGVLNYEINIGASFRFDFAWYFPDDPDDAESEFNTPQDLTGWTGEVTCPTLGSFPLTMTLGGIDGTIEGQILDTSAWTVGSHDYELVMTAPDATIDTILIGKIKVDRVPVF